MFILALRARCFSGASAGRRPAVHAVRSRDVPPVVGVEIKGYLVTSLLYCRSLFFQGLFLFLASLFLFSVRVCGAFFRM